MLKRNYSLTLPVIFTLGLFLVLINIFIFLGKVSDHVFSELSGKVTFTAYLDPDADFLRVQRLMEELEKMETVKPPVVYASAESAKKAFESSLGLQEFDTVNFPSTLKITPRFPSDQKTIRKFLKEGPYSDLLAENTAQIQSSEEKTFEAVSQKLQNLESLSKTVLSLIFFVTALTGIFILVSLLKLETHARKTEMAVMKLVGAPTHALEMPFILESVMTGIFAWAIGIFLTVFLPFFPFFPDDPILKDLFRSLPFANIFLLELLGVFLLSLSAGFIFLYGINRGKNRLLHFH